MQEEKSWLSNELILQLMKLGIYIKKGNSRTSYSLDASSDFNLGKTSIHSDLWRELLRKR